MRAEHLKKWLAEAEDEEKPDDRRWKVIVEIVQTAFSTGEMAEEMVWQIIALIPKGGGAFRGVGLVEVLWKVVAIIIDRRMGVIEFHDVIHGFRVRRGTGTASIEAKLLHQVAAMQEEVLYTIFLDLHKAYDALDRTWCLAILQGWRRKYDV